MHADACTPVLKEALQTYGTPEIFNTDQGSQYTSDTFTKILKNKGIRISMDGKGRALDNVFVERLWRTVKQEYIYLNENRTVKELRKGLARFFRKYNEYRLHQSLEDNTPNDVNFKIATLKNVA
jgi:putative transposase